MATKPFLQFNQRLNDLYRRNSSYAHQQQQQKIYYRKGRIPTIGNEQKPGYVCCLHPKGQIMMFSNDSHRVQAKRSQLKREITHMRMQINEQRFFRKAANNTPKRITEQYKPKRRVTTELSPEGKTEFLPLLLRRQSNYLDKMRIAVENCAEKDIAEIEAKALARSTKQRQNHKFMIDGLKGKCFYAMMRDLSVPDSFST